MRRARDAEDPRETFTSRHWFSGTQASVCVCEKHPRLRALRPGQSCKCETVSPSDARALGGAPSTRHSLGPACSLPTA